MKFLLVVAAVAAVAVAGPTRALVTPEIAGPAPVIVDEYHPVHVGPAIVDQYHPVHVGPAIVDEYHPIHVGPAIIDEYHPIHVGPAIIDEYGPVDDSIQIGPGIIEGDSPAVVELPVIDFPVPDGAVEASPADVPAISNLPLVQIIVNVQQQAGAVPPASPVQVIEKPAEEEVAPTPVEIVEEAVNDYEPVLVMDPFPVVPEPVVVAPIAPAPAVVAPEILN